MRVPLPCLSKPLCDVPIEVTLKQKLLDPLTPRVKPWVIQRFLPFDSNDRTLKCNHSLELCCGAVYFSILASL